MKKITINNQEFEETNASIPMTDWTWYQNKWYKPVEKFKVGDWVTFWSEVNKRSFTSKIKEWTSHSYCILEGGLEPFKQLLKKATSQEILEHLRTIAKEKELVKGARVRRINEIDKGVFVTIVQEMDDYYPETDEYAKSGIILYSNGKWAEKVENPNPLNLKLNKEYTILYKHYPSNPIKVKITRFTDLGHAWGEFENGQNGIITDCYTLIKEIEKVKDYEILSFIDSSNDNIFDEIDNSQTFTKYFSKKTKTYVTLNDLESSLSYFKIHSVKCLKTGNVYTIGDKVEYQNTPYILNNIVLKNNTLQIDLNGMCVMLSLTDIKTYKPKFTFGGQEVTFKVVSSGEKYNFKTVEINCKGETGTHHQLANILTHYFRPIPFGRVFVKKWLPKKATYIDVHLGLNTFAANDDLANVEEVTISCLTGKYKELVDIFNHCQKLLK